MENQKRKICLITPSHIASNPRLVKEARALIAAGYRVHIVFTQNLDRLAKNDQHILAQNPEWTYDLLFLSPKKPAYKVAALRQKLAGLFKKQTPLSLNRHFNWQLARAVESKADLYIAHNLGALQVAYFASKKTGAKWAFDAEDFHRHEETDDLHNPDVRRKIFVEETYMPKADYLTAASPMIAKAYADILNKPVIPVLNVFEMHDPQPVITADGGPLRIFWFSQTIGPYRGIEVALLAIQQIKSFRVELHLLGEISGEYRSALLNLSQAFADLGHLLSFHASVEPDELLRKASEFDAGLAAELSTNLNKQYCLSNKIFTYVQCGLALLVSDTPAQAGFMRENPRTGKLYRQNDPSSLAEAIRFLAADRKRLSNIRLANYRLGCEKYNWELESQKFLEIIKATIG